MKQLGSLLFVAIFLPALVVAQYDKQSGKACLDLRSGKILVAMDCVKTVGPIVWGTSQKGTFEPTNMVEFPERATEPDSTFTPGWIELRTGRTHFDYEGRGPEAPYLRGRIDPKGGFHVNPDELTKWTGGKEYVRQEKPSAGKGGSQQALITSLEGNNVVVRFTPKEITMEKAATWNKTGLSDTLAFQAGGRKTLEVEVDFESSSGVYESYVRQLENLSDIDPGLQRPPKCSFTWGSNFPRFNGVVENLSVKYTQFLSDGTPVRATVNVRMLEASRLLNEAESRQMRR